VGFLCVWGLMKPFKFYFTLVINVLKVIFDSSCLSCFQFLVLGAKLVRVMVYT
jgi:hypothetical protein